jgi:hypothetical protein
MPSHFSTIGFAIEAEEDLFAVVDSLASQARTHVLDHGSYLEWRCPSGAAMWLQLDAEGDLVGVNPHFTGKARLPIAVTSRIRRKTDTELDGAFHAWANPEGEQVESGAYPFVFDAPDAARHAKLALPARTIVQVAAFAHEVEIFGSEAEREASLPKDGPEFASRSFVPTGLFKDAGDESPPEAHAIFTGEILEVATLFNSFSTRRFCWALVSTLGGDYDVVLDDALIAEEPPVGGILSGSFWLSGRIAGAAS